MGDLEKQYLDQVRANFVKGALDWDGVWRQICRHFSNRSLGQKQQMHAYCIKTW